MIAVIIGATAVLVARLRLSVVRATDGWRVALRYGIFSLMSIGPHRIRKRRARRSAAPKRKRRLTVPFRALLEATPQLVPASWRSLRFLVRHTRLDRCAIGGSIEGGDPAETGMLFACLSLLVGFLGVWFSKVDVAVEPGFLQQGTYLWFEAELSIRAAALLVFPLVFLFHAPKKKLVRIAISSIRR